MPRKIDRILDEAEKAMRAGDFKGAIKLSDKALAEAEKSGDAVDRFECLLALGSNCAAAGQKTQAHDNYVRALNLTNWSDSIGPFQVGMCLSSLGTVLFDLDNLEDCEQISNQALDILDSDLVKDRFYAFLPLETLCRLYIKLEKYEVALAYYDRAASVLKEYENPNAAQFGAMLDLRRAELDAAGVSTTA